MALTSSEAHDLLVEAWTKPPAYCNLRLVARLADPVLGNPDASNVFVFIPDLHLVADDRVDRYSYATNHWEILYRSLLRLSACRDTLDRDGTRVQVVQMGDLFDLWRDGHGQHRDSVHEIVGSWGNLLKLLYRGKQDPKCLDARLLVGNHDAPMAGTPNWYLRLFLPTESSQAFALALHGDWLDPAERLPDWLSQFGVYIGGRVPSAKAYPLGELRQLLEQRAQAENGFRDWIQHRSPITLEPSAMAPETALLPTEHNVLRKSRGDTHPFLGDVVRLIAAQRGKPDASPGFDNLRLVVIGHTHHARLAIDDTCVPPVALLDTGAWIEKYSDAAGHVHPNCQVSVVCGNDARIYQFDPR